jgi:hypothetical protein
MKLELRAITSPMVDPREPAIDRQVSPQEGVTALALRIQLRDALSEMHLNDDSVTRPDHGNGAAGFRQRA